MNKIGLTQRVEVTESYGERRDCLDQEWTTLLSSYTPIPLPNKVEYVSEYLDELSLDGIILTSGNDLATLEKPDQPAPERDRFEEQVLTYAINKDIPVLGVCRGVEFIAVHFGGALCEVSDHVGSTHSVEFTPRSTAIEFPESVTVNSYHDYGIEPADLPDEIDVLGTAPDGTVECIRHESYPIWGIMWHPERKSPSATVDRQLLQHVFPTVTK